MAEITIFVNEAISGPQIQQIEDILNRLDGIVTVLVDTADGEIKIEFDGNETSEEKIGMTIQEHDYHIITKRA